MEIISAIVTIISFIVVTVARDIRDGKQLFKKNGSYENQKTLREIRDSQMELQLHFNDETTKELQNIGFKLDKLINGSVAANTKLDVLIQSK